MSDSEQDPFYLFLHIPKTAGTTLRSIVDQNLGLKMFSPITIRTHGNSRTIWMRISPSSRIFEPSLAILDLASISVLIGLQHI